MPQPHLHVQDVVKTFGAQTAVDHVSLEIAAGEFFSLLGPSGCGKTTLLRMIAGFEFPDSGKILLDGVDLAPLPPHKRPVNTVFQHYALFPHMDVWENVAFGLRRQKVPEGDVKRRVDEALDDVRLGEFARRMPAQLSGGQKQRVALARALVLRPGVLLLDEPLGALDHKLRLEMQVELKEIQRACGITFIFVTHDQPEALTMSDRIAVFSRGRIEQIGSPFAVYEKPTTPFVARFLGASNLLPGRVESADGARVTVALAAGPTAGLEQDGRPAAPGQDACVMIRPEWFRLTAGRPAVAGWHSVPVTVSQRIYQGSITRWTVSGLGGLSLEVTGTPGVVPPEGPADEDVPPGASAWLSWRDGTGVLLPPEKAAS